MPNAHPQYSGPLDGIRVLDLSRILAGPSCTQLLGDYGAEIIKVERPGLGDDTRAWGPPYVKDDNGQDTTESAYYLCANRNKLSLALDISSSEGQQTIRELVKSCDILVENFKVGGLAAFGLSYDDLKADNPALIYCSITGFGQTGPNAKLPGYDLLAQGAGGIMSLTGDPDGEPMKVGVAVADIVCGMYASTAILAALHHRGNTGQGQHIDIALADTQVAWLANQGSNYLISGKAPKRLGNQHPNIVPYQVFEVVDGHAIVAVGNDAQFGRFCDILGLAQLANDPKYKTNDARVKHKSELINILAPALKKISKSDLLSAMDAASVPGGPINTIPEVFASDQVATRGMKIHMEHKDTAQGINLIANPVKFSKTPVSYRYAPPTCGQHTEDILSRLKKP